MIDYVILDTISIKMMQVKVKDLLSKGYELQGGICKSSGVYYQALIKRPLI